MLLDWTQRLRRFPAGYSYVREIEETEYAQDTDHNLKTVAELRQSGFPIEMGDFGSG